MCGPGGALLAPPASRCRRSCTRSCAPQPRRREGWQPLRQLLQARAWKPLRQPLHAQAETVVPPLQPQLGGTTACTTTADTTLCPRFVVEPRGGWADACTSVATIIGRAFVGWLGGGPTPPAKAQKKNFTARLSVCFLSFFRGACCLLDVSHLGKETEVPAVLHGARSYDRDRGRGPGGGRGRCASAGHRRAAGDAQRTLE